jgi:hypothetical protein
MDAVSYTLGRWPLIRDEYLWCLLPCLELIMLSVSVHIDSGACGGSRCSDWCVTLSVHCEPPSDWLEPSAETNQLTTRPLKHGKCALSSMISSLTTLEINSIVKFLMIQAVKTRLMCLRCGLMAPRKPSKDRTGTSKIDERATFRRLTSWKLPEIVVHRLEKELVIGAI